VQIRFHPSAARHGIAAERVVYVILNAPASFEQEDRLLLVLGPNQRGVPLEVVVIELEDGDLLVIHAMRMRHAYRELLGQVMGWH
jgi:hypothetical protein